MEKSNNDSQITNKYGLNATMFLIGNMNPLDLFAGSNFEYKDDIENVLKANNFELTEQTEELAIDLIYLGMIYGFRQVENHKGE